MPAPLSGPGVGLQVPQYLYPTELFNSPYDFGTNVLTLYPGDELPIPAGNWWVNPGTYSVIQYNDPIIGTWRFFNVAAMRGREYIKSDGFNFRVANLTGCPVCAVVLNSGSGYAQATTTVVASSGNSTWLPIVGGQISINSITNAGAGYGVEPVIIFAAPPSPGIPATGYCVITGGSVTSVVMTNQGAGYVSAPAGVILPNPTDPNINTGITNATVSVAVIGAGSIAAIICTNPGVSISAIPTLTIAGAGSGASAAAIRMVTLISAAVSSSGTWTGGAAFSTIGGGTNTTAGVTNPLADYSNFIPRPASALLSGGSSSLTSIGTLVDGGLFLTAPTGLIQPVSGNFAPAASTATVTGTYAGAVDTIVLQPAP